MEIWIPSRRKLQLPHTKVSIPLGLVQVQSLCYAKHQAIFWGKHFFLKFPLLFMSHFPLPSSLPLPASLQAEICFSQLLLRLWLYCMGEVSPEGHLFHQVFYLHPKLYVHEKCGRVLHLAADADEILWKAWCTLTFADGAAIAEKWIA